MARVRIDDLPKDTKISKEEMKKVVGGLYLGNFTATLDEPTTKAYAEGVAEGTSKGTSSGTFKSFGGPLVFGSAE